MAGKHTPGPWYVSGCRDKLPRFDSHRIVGPNETHIASVVYEPKTHSSDWHNAKLIAAAPELLEALKVLIDVCDGNYRELTTEMQTLCDRADGKYA